MARLSETRMIDWSAMSWWEGALLATLILLALAGAYYICRSHFSGYVFLPTMSTTICRHDGREEMHFLAYITPDEHKVLMSRGGLGLRQRGTQGVPCYPETENKAKAKEAAQSDDDGFESAEDEEGQDLGADLVDGKTLLAPRLDAHGEWVDPGDQELVADAEFEESKEYPMPQTNPNRPGGLTGKVVSNAEMAALLNPRIRNLIAHDARMKRDDPG